MFESKFKHVAEKLVAGSELQHNCQKHLEFSIENAEIMENCP